MKNVAVKFILACCLIGIKSLFADEKDFEIKSIVAINDSTVSYELFIPDTISQNLINKPVFFFFEPWGNGIYPVSIYKELARRHGVALIGFNTSRNGMTFEESNQKFTIAVNDLIKRYGLNTNLLGIVGFSGGGKVALKISESITDIKYVIYGGSAIEVTLYNKSILGFAGTEDMNYIDLLNFDLSLGQQKDIQHVIVEYNGPHAWFDSSTMENSFIWFKLNLFLNKALAYDSLFIASFIVQNKEEINDLIKNKQWIKAYQRTSKVMHFLHELTSIDWFTEKAKFIEKESSFKKSQKQLQYVIETEKQTKNNYLIYLFSRDTIWWKAEMERLNENGNNFQMQSNKRLKGCIYAYCYYFSNNAFDENNLIAAEKILDIFKSAFPKSSEQAFLRAVLWAKKNNTAKSDEAFDEAKKLGFNEWDKNDKESILQYFRNRDLK